MNFIHWLRSLFVTDIKISVKSKRPKKTAKRVDKKARK